VTVATVVPHFAFPFRVGPSGMATVEQDSLEEIAQCVEVVVRTRPGDRIENPELGVTDLTFSADPVPDRAVITAAVEVWEPRASVLVSDAPNLLDELVRYVSVRVTAGGSA
jgi:phage baseplate assembly protein W